MLSGFSLGLSQRGGVTLGHVSCMWRHISWPVTDSFCHSELKLEEHPEHVRAVQTFQRYPYLFLSPSF